MDTISGVYKITNTITNDFYIGSSKNVKSRWAVHKCPSKWKENPNNLMYLDMKKYGTDKFVFEILAEVEPEQLKDTEQQFIEKLKPTYNQVNAKGLNIERRKETHRKAQKKYDKSDKRKESQRKYHKSDKGKESLRKAQNKYYKSDKGKESQKKYQSQLCSFNGETITLGALSKRFQRASIPHPNIEAKKYLIKR